MLRGSIFAAILLAAACASEAMPDGGATARDAGMGDAAAADATPHDAAVTDAGARDATAADATASDAAPADATTPDAATPDATPADATSPDASLPIGAPIVVPTDTWTWVDFPDSACNDGTATGLGVRTSSTSQNLLVFLNGGGLCWDYETCIVLSTAATGPFQRQHFELGIANLPAGSTFDRRLAANPFRDWNMVFVPYCTGDLHAGRNVATYRDGAMTATFRHVGAANFDAFLARLRPTFPAPPKIALIGSSAGGYGALFQADRTRAYWPGASLYLVDDSGPLLAGDAIPAAMRAAWYASWRLGDLLDPLCGQACRADLSALHPALAARHPGMRIGLLASTRDMVIARYFMLTGANLEAATLSLAAGVLDPLPRARSFVVAGDRHTMLIAPGGFTSENTPLLEWLSDEVGDAPGWSSKRPR